ncbi:hypothetical protein AB3N59_04050 [Leptospira sp. WS92.C1]
MLFLLFQEGNGEVPKKVKFIGEWEVAVPTFLQDAIVSSMSVAFLLEIEVVVPTKF